MLADCLRTRHHDWSGLDRPLRDNPEMSDSQSRIRRQRVLEGAEGEFQVGYQGVDFDAFGNPGDGI